MLASCWLGSWICVARTKASIRSGCTLRYVPDLVQLISRWLRYGRHSRPLAGSMADQGEISGGTSCRSSMRQTDKLSNTHSLMMTISVPSELACLALLGSVQLSSWRCLPWLSLRHRAQLTDRGFQFVGRNRSRVVISFGFQRECVWGPPQQPFARVIW
jgi:predicted DCC family thiol-disulfide oxidoreductase YuxK